MLVFDFIVFINELRADSEKCKMIESYEKLVESFDGKQIHELKFYQDYYSKINATPYKVPEEYKNDFDWDLLARLTIGSISSEYSFEFSNDEDDLPELIISASSGNGSVTKMISELWSFQIFKMYEIYISEAINLQWLMVDSDLEFNTIDSFRKEKLTKWDSSYKKLKRKHKSLEVAKIRSELDKLID